MLCIFQVLACLMEKNRYGSGWNFDPGDFLEANGFDRAMADDPSFKLLDHESDYVYQ